MKIVVIGNTSSVYISEMPVENYRKAKIILQRHQSLLGVVRVCEVVFGIVEYLRQR